MRLEVPFLTRCCFCIPLRYGLIVWGCFRVITTAMLLLELLYYLLVFVSLAYVYQASTQMLLKYLSIGIVIVLVGVVDMAVNIRFMIGSYKKNVKWLELYFTYSFLLCVLVAVFGVIATIFTWYAFKDDSVLTKGVLIMIAQIVVQVYALILIHSEIVKLKNSCQSTLKNNGELANVLEPKQCIEVPVEV